MKFKTDVCLKNRPYIDGKNFLWAIFNRAVSAERTSAQHRVVPAAGAPVPL